MTLRTKLMVAFLSVGMAPAVTLGWRTWSSTLAMTDDVGRSYESTAAGIADKIDRNLFERYGDVQAFGLNQAVLDRESWYRRGSASNRIAAAANSYATLYGIYLLALVVDLEGRVVAVNDRDPQGRPVETSFLYDRNYRQAAWFQDALAGRFMASKAGTLTGTVVEAPAFDPDVRQIYGAQDYVIGFAAPIKDARGRVVGVWRNLARFSLIDEIVQTEHRELTARGLAEAELTLIDHEGRLLLSYDPSGEGTPEIRHDASRLLKQNLADAGLQPARELVAGRSGHGFARHERKDVSQVVGYAVSRGALGWPGFGWGVLVRVHDTTALAGTVAIQRQVWLVLVLSAVVLGVVAWWLARALTRPLAAASDVLGSVAAGDLRCELTVDSRDEIGTLAKALNVAVREMSTALLRVQKAATEVSSASAALTTGASTIASGAQSQAASLEETAASLEEMTASVRQTADRAVAANRLAQDARVTAERSGDLVGAAVGAMDEITHASRRIAEIIGTVNDIAFQTNVLAINAAVEAARAGEQGRGFAVVASEVRKLAGRSADSAKEIRSLIEDSLEKVDNGGSLVRQSGDRLRDLVAAFGRVSDVVAEIASASREQAAGIDLASRAVAQMESVTQASATETERLSSMAIGLSRQAMELEGAVARFSVGSAPSPRGEDGTDERDSSLAA